MSNDLLDNAKQLPDSPGCYLMKNKNGHVIYIGKAKSLTKRVRTYFNNSKKDPKTEILVGHIINFDFFLTENEAEALILENNLIKKYSPKYNILLKDDKSFPYAVINLEEPFPRIEYTRRPPKNDRKKKKNTLVYGPFVAAGNLSQTIKILTKSFKLRDCSLKEFKSRKRPCLLHQMNKCSAPCVGYITPEDYKSDLDYAINLFMGKGKNTIRIIKSTMQKASKDQEFERALILRDSLNELTFFIDSFYENNVSLNSEFSDIDVIAYYIGKEECDVTIYMVRHNLLLGQKSFNFLSQGTSIKTSEEEIINLTTQYYLTTNDPLPKLIITSFNKEQVELLGEAFKDQNIKVKNASKTFNSILDMSKRHAQESQKIRQSNQESSYIALNKLKQLLSLKEIPKVIECVDIAVWQGKSPTASQVVFHDGKPYKKAYRHYNLKELPEGNNDFAMMEEFITRRIKNNNFPDLFLVDGGTAQVNTILKILKQNNIDTPVIGIAKSRNLKKGFLSQNTKSQERLIIPNRSNPYILEKTPSLFRLMTTMRDEAHRFSRRLHHKKEHQRVIPKTNNTLTKRK